MRRPFLLSALVAAFLLPPLTAAAETVFTLGVYLWTNADSEPVRAQYMSIASGTAEAEIDGPEGYKSTSRPVTEEELNLMKAAIQDRMSALTLDEKPQIDPPFVTVEWHFSDETGYAEGIGTYPLKEVPAAVATFQKAAFGASYENVALPPAEPAKPAKPATPGEPAAPASAD